MYKVVLDEKHSYIELVNSELVNSEGFSFEEAVTQIIEYARESSYDLQEAIWEMILSEGEDRFSSPTVSLS